MLNKIFYKNYNPVTAVEAEGERALSGKRPGSFALSQGFSRHVFFSPSFFSLGGSFYFLFETWFCCIGLKLTM